MTRRAFLYAAAAPAIPRTVTVPMHRVIDSRARCTPEERARFWGKVWPEAMRDFGRGGIRFEVTDVPGEIKRSPGGRPFFAGLTRGALNVVLTDHLPNDYGAVAGATTIHEGYHLSVIAMSYAHPNQVPYFSVNTCTHEWLHAIVGDIFVNRPKWYQAGERELRVDLYATRLWLYGDGAEVRRRAAIYLRRLSAAPAPMTPATRTASTL